MIEAASVHSGLIEFLKWDLTRANWVSPFTRETNSASKWLFTDSFTAGFKEKCRQFSPLRINISRNFFETIPFPFEIVEIEDRREGILKFQISHSFEYSKTFVRKGNYLTDLNFKFPRVVHLGRSRSYLYFFILSDPSVSIRKEGDGILSTAELYPSLNFTGSSDRAARQVNHARDKTSRGD